MRPNNHAMIACSVIDISSKFDTGKSTFFRMWKYFLENDIQIVDKLTAVLLNVWESSYRRGIQEHAQIE